MMITKPDAWIAYGAPRDATGNASTDVFTLNAHGLQVGDQVIFASLTGGTGLATNTVYTVRATSDANSFTLNDSTGAQALFSTNLTASAMRLAIDLTPHVVSVSPDAPASTSDGRTFAAPHRSRASAGNQSITMSLIWSAGLMDALAPFVGDDGDLTVIPVKGQAGKLIATVKYAVLPLGEIRIGEQATVDLTLAVRDRIAFDV